MLILSVLLYTAGCTCPELNSNYFRKTSGTVSYTPGSYGCERTDLLAILTKRVKTYENVLYYESGIKVVLYFL